MTLGAVSYYTLLITPFAVQAVMLTLQLGAYRRYAHLSFLLLSAATSCGILFLVIPLAYRWWNGIGMRVSLTWYVVSVLALLAQCVLTVWGTVSLFRSYGVLAAAVARTTSAAEAPNNRWRGP